MCLLRSAFIFMKEDENLHPNVSFCPLKERVRLTTHMIERQREFREGRGIIYTPHIGTTPLQLIENVTIAAEAGATGVMFSEQYSGGMVRVVRERMKDWEKPLVIYGHTGGICTRTRHIWREVLDYFARLDGVDIHQSGLYLRRAYLRPGGLEWEKCEEVLTKSIDGIKPVMLARSGGLDQGNLIINLEDINKKRVIGNYLLLCGSAINGHKNDKGMEDPQGGIRAIRQAIAAYEDFDFDNSEENHQERLFEYAAKKGYNELRNSLKQRYPHLFR